jgi:hypothetical protein
MYGRSASSTSTQVANARSIRDRVVAFPAMYAAEPKEDAAEVRALTDADRDTFIHMAMRPPA